jgi:hypothetical protein
VPQPPVRELKRYIRVPYSRAHAASTRVPDTKLVGSRAGPFVQIVLAEQRIDYEFVVHTPNDADSRASDFDPPGKVPALVTDDGAAIYRPPLEVTEPRDAAAG